MKKYYLIYLFLMLIAPFSAFSQTVHSVSDTSYNADQSIAYYVNTTVVSVEGKNTVTFAITPGTSALGEIFDLNIYRDTDARFKDRLRIAKQVSLPENGVFIFEDEHANWLNDGGGDYGYTGDGVLPSNIPMFYSLVISRLEEFGGAARPRRSYPAIHLPEQPETVVVDEINENMTLVSQVFPNSEDTTVIVKLDFAPDYNYYQQVLAEALPGEPLYPAGDKLVFFGKAYLNNMADPNGRTDIGYGNLYWGYEGSAYAKIKVAPEFLDANGSAYLWLTSGRPGHSTVEPIAINFDLEDEEPSGGQTVHVVADTSYNSDQSVAYYVNTTVISVEGKNTVTFAITPGTSALGEIFDLNIYRDTDARFKDRLRIAKQVPLPANGVFIFEDEHADWLNDGGGDYGYTGDGVLPSDIPMFYSLVISRLEEFGGAARPRRSYPALYLPEQPETVVVDEINENMTLVSQVFPNSEDTTVIVKLDFAPDYNYYQQVLAEALPGEPLYPAGDKLVFFGKAYLNNMADPNGRTDIGYGNLYWGYEGSAYAKIKVAPEFLDENGSAYLWLTSGRPGHSTVEPIAINFDLEEEPSGGQTVHSVADTCYNSDLSVAYYLNTTVVSVDGKNTVTFAITPGTSALGEIFDLNIYRDTDARFKDRTRIAKAVQLPENGTFIFEDSSAEWIDDGGGDYGYTPSGDLPSDIPMFYSLVISRLEAFGGAARPRRSYPAIHLPEAPKNVIVDDINDDMTLVTQVFPSPADSSVILKLDFAPDYSYFQQVLAEALPGEPLYPAGDKLVFFGKVYLNNMSDPNGRTDIGYGNLYWGHEGSAYAKFKVGEEFLDSDGITYCWLTSGRPGHSTVVPIPIELFGTVSTNDVTELIDLDVYPNPTDGLINIESSDNIDLITVYNVSGQIVHSQKMNRSTFNTNIDLSNNATGIYYVQVKSNNTLITKKVILK